MSSPLANELANILTAVVAQIRGLTDDEVKALAAGESEFRLVARKPTRKPKTESTMDKAVDRVVDKIEPAVDPAVVSAELKRCTTESEALAYLQGLKLNLAAAKALATALGLRLPARPSVTSISAEIIRVFVGGRLNAATVQRL